MNRAALTCAALLAGVGLTLVKAAPQVPDGAWSAPPVRGSEDSR